MDKPLSLTYDELLAETRQMLKQLSERSSTDPDSFERGSSSGVIYFWYQLALKTSPAYEQLQEDLSQLFVLAGLKPPADVL